MRKVLIVDDDDLCLSYLSRLLRRYFDVIVADDAFHAILALEKMSIDAIVTDFELRTENGLWLLDEVRRRFPATRRLLVSGFPLTKVDEYKSENLFEQFFPKPLRVMSIVAALEPKAA